MSTITIKLFIRFYYAECVNIVPFNVRIQEEAMLGNCSRLSQFVQFKQTLARRIHDWSHASTIKSRSPQTTLYLVLHLDNLNVLKGPTGKICRGSDQENVQSVMPDQSTGKPVYTWSWTSRRYVRRSVMWRPQISTDFQRNIIW